MSSHLPCVGSSVASQQTEGLIPQHLWPVFLWFINIHGPLLGKRIFLLLADIRLGQMICPGRGNEQKWHPSLPGRRFKGHLEAYHMLLSLSHKTGHIPNPALRQPSPRERAARSSLAVSLSETSGRCEKKRWACELLRFKGCL